MYHVLYTEIFDDAPLNGDMLSHSMYMASYYYTDPNQVFVTICYFVLIMLLL